MSFDTPAYVLFLAAVALLYRHCPRRFRQTLLLFCSLFFYACWSVPLTLVILGVIALTWGCALGIEKTRRNGLKKLWLAAAAAGCAGLLIWFKYFNFLAENLCALAGGQWTPRRILLPVGCSFYTFQALSYVIDVRRGKQPAVRSPMQYALFICFFPQLVAGPIERAETLMPQLTETKDPSGEETRLGVRMLLTGFFRKLVIADLAGRFVTRVFAAPCPDGSAVAIGALLFSFQIYCDFAGYSDIARGSALLLGIRLRPNFDRPYLARSPREFWRRWHMSLTSWFTDYVYIPMGGNRRGPGRQILATLTVFLLSGLWHGANWTFVLWGLFHGALCTGEILLSRGKAAAKPGKPGIRWLMTFLAVTASWILFRAESPGHAFQMLGALFSAWDFRAGLALAGIGWQEAACLLAALLQLPLLYRLSRGEKANETTMFFLAACILAAWFVRAAANGSGTFIYFQF